MMRFTWCTFGFHDWTNWETVRRFAIGITRPDRLTEDIVGSGFVQERMCEVCGKLAVRRIETRFED